MIVDQVCYCHLLCNTVLPITNEDFDAKECVERLDLKVLLLTLEVVSVFVSYDHHCFQTISFSSAVQTPHHSTSY